MGKIGNTTCSFRSVALDFAAFALLLAGLNAVLASADPFWLNANPNPWLLLPVYLGCRYGFVAGCLTGLMTASGAAGAAAWRGDLTLSETLLEHRPLLLGFPVGGILTGAVRSLLNQQFTEAETRATAAEKENVRLRSDNVVLDETRYQLQQRLALFGAETCALDQQLRTLFAPTAEPLLPRCLRLLRSSANVSSCCVAELQPDGSGRVIAALDSKWQRSDAIPAEKLTIGRAAIEKKSTVTWKLALLHAESDFLAAVPWGHVSNNVVLLVEDMPFAAISQSAFVRVEVLVQWIARYAPKPNRSGAETDAAPDAWSTGTFVTAEEFDSRGELARETFERLRLPSVIAEFEDSAPLNGAPGQASVIELLQAAVHEKMQAPRVACAASESGNLRVLLPMEGRRDAELFVAAVVHPLEAEGRVQMGRIRHQLIEIGANGSDNRDKT